MKNVLKVAWLFVAFALVFSTYSFADAGGDLFKAKCAACHGPEGAGKVGPAVKGTKVDVAAFVQNGEAGKKAPHTKGVSGVSADQAKAVAEYVKSLK